MQTQSGIKTSVVREHTKTILLQKAANHIYAYRFEGRFSVPRSLDTVSQPAARTRRLGTIVLFRSNRQN